MNNPDPFDLEKRRQTEQVNAAFTAMSAPVHDDIDLAAVALATLADQVKAIEEGMEK